MANDSDSSLVTTSQIQDVLSTRGIPTAKRTIQSWLEKYPRAGRRGRANLYARTTIDMIAREHGNDAFNNKALKNATIEWQHEKQLMDTPDLFFQNKVAETVEQKVKDFMLEAIFYDGATQARTIDIDLIKNDVSEVVLFSINKAGNVLDSATYLAQQRLDDYHNYVGYKK